MGILFVAIFWIAILILSASLFSFILILATSYSTRGIEPIKRRQVILIAGACPFISSAWILVMFVVLALINVCLLGRDAGIGDGFHCPLLNEYSVEMIDILDYGTIYKPKILPPGEGDFEGRKDEVNEVRKMQISGNYILGKIGHRDLATWPYSEDKQSVEYFILDTKAGVVATYKTYDEFGKAASELNIKLNLQPIEEVYHEYRSTWVDGFFPLLMLLGPILAVVIPARLISRLRSVGGS
jgi:hypothetical protein